MTPVERYLSRHGIRARDLLYLSREDGQTVVHLRDGRRLTTYRTVKEFAASLPQDHYLSVNKGILVRRDAIASESGGTLLLIDGTRLCGRRRQRSTPFSETKEAYLDRILRRYAIFDAHPAAHWLYSLSLFDGEQGPVLRYRNRAAEHLACESTAALCDAIMAVLQRGESCFCDRFHLYSPEDGYCFVVFSDCNN